MIDDFLNFIMANSALILFCIIALGCLVATFKVLGSADDIRTDRKTQTVVGLAFVIIPASRLIIFS